MSMPKGRPLTFYEREKIEVYLRMKKKKIWIAEKLNRDYSVIKREIKRNSGEQLPYNAVDAQYFADRRKRKTNKRKLEKWQNVKLKEYVINRLEDGWSPDEIAGRLKEYPPEELSECKDKSVSYESIYSWIYEGEGRYGGLYKKLRRKQKARKKSFSRKYRSSGIKERVSIHERPEIIDKRKRIGDWETDSVIFSGKSTLCVNYERKSMKVLIRKCEDKSASSFEESLRDCIESLPGNMWLSITRDNGSENVLHRETGVQSFFCDSYSSWQKGGVENANGLIREYFPKRSNLDNISEREIYLVEERLNNRPRKKLNYLTPNEVIALEISKKGL
ncbi:MAG: IS30 family transposase [Candidatus Moranbacteria bacterium]|nr:IS30 family transposase [Candidatus Moranbacteria bacterium]